MNGRIRYLLAAVCAIAAGLLTLVYLGGRGSAETGETEIIWVAAESVSPGAQLSESVLQQVRVDGPTRKLLAGDALPTAPTDAPGGWYASRPIAPGQPLVPGQNVSTQPAPALPDGLTAGDLRVVTLVVDQLPPGADLAGEAVDIYAIPEQSGEAVRILERAQVTVAADGLLAVLVPEPRVAAVLTVAEGSRLKVVRRYMEMAP